MNCQLYPLELFLAMDLCDGGDAHSLYEVLEAPVPENLIALVMRESMKGLAYLHDVTLSSLWLCCFPCHSCDYFLHVMINSSNN